MPRKPRLAISAVRDLAQSAGMRQIIVLSLDDSGTEHIATYGRTVIDCDQAAVGAERLKAFLNWPEILTEPPRVKKYRAQRDKLHDAARAFLDAFQTKESSEGLVELIQKVISDHHKPSPMCRDCADNNGTCPGTDEPCDPHERLARRILAALHNRQTAQELSKARVDLVKMLVANKT